MMKKLFIISGLGQLPYLCRIDDDVTGTTGQAAAAERKQFVNAALANDFHYG